MPKLLAIVLLVLNSIVLLGQLWPEGAPPFAHIVNVAVLIADVATFAWLALRGRAMRA